MDRLPQGWKLLDPITQGHIHQTWKLEIPSAADEPALALLQRINTAIFTDPEALMANAQRVCAHLIDQQDYPLLAPTYWPWPDGRYLRADSQGGIWRLQRYISHAYASPIPETSAEAHSVGAALGAFLRAMECLPPSELAPLIPHFHDPALRPLHYDQAMAAASAERLAAAREQIAALRDIRWIFERIAALIARHQVPLRVVHNDAKASNVLLDRRSGQAVAVVDLDTVMPSWAMVDYGDLIRSCAPSADEEAPAERLTIRPWAFEAAHQGFVEAAGNALSQSERDSLFLGALWLSAEQAMRFLTDFLQGDRYYPIRSPWHNLERARNQLRLFHLLIPM